MVQLSQYPDERQARRVLELAFPDVDEDVRQNLAYLVSARRMTIDAALAKLESGIEDDGAASTPHIQRVTTTAKAPSTPPFHNGRGTGTATTTTTTAAAITNSSGINQPSSQRGYLRGERAEAPAVAQRHDELDDSDSEEGDPNYRRRNARNTVTTTSVAGRGRVASYKAAAPAKKPTSNSPSVPPCSAESLRSNSSTQPASLIASPSTIQTNNTINRSNSNTNDTNTVRQDQYIRRRSDNQVSRSNLELQEPRKSLTRDEEESAQHSAPGVLTSVPTARVGSGSGSAAQRQYTDVSVRTGSRGGALEDETVLEATPKKSMLAEPAEEKPAFSRPLGAAAPLLDKEKGEAEQGADPMFTNTKLVTDDEKADYERKMKDMMHYWYGDETSMYDYTLRSLPAGQVLFFMTSMTGDRQVRDHCRQMENLLYLKLIPHNTIDVADSEFFLRRVRRMYTHATQKRATPEMPLLFVDDKLIGDFTTVQELEDAGELDAALLDAGCSVLRSRVVDEVAAKRSGLPSTRLTLPTRARKPSDTRAVPPSSCNSEAKEEAEDGAQRAALSAPKHTSTASTSSTSTTRLLPSSTPTPATIKDERGASNASGSGSTAKSSAAARAAAAARGASTASPAPSPPVSCFHNGRRLDRPSDDLTPAPTPATRPPATPAATKGYGDEYSSGITAPSVERSLRSGNRNALGGDGVTVGDMEKHSHVSEVPRLPSLASRSCETRDTDLTKPAASTSTNRRYSAQSRSAAAAAAVADRCW